MVGAFGRLGVYPDFFFLLAYQFCQACNEGGVSLQKPLILSYPGPPLMDLRTTEGRCRTLHRV